VRLKLRTLIGAGEPCQHRSDWLIVIAAANRRGHLAEDGAVSFEAE
jgi:hypothetical protein